MTIFKTFSSMLGAFVVLCMLFSVQIRAERDERAHAKGHVLDIAKTLSSTEEAADFAEKGHVFDIAKAPSSIEEAADFMQLADSTGQDCTDKSFFDCAKEPGCEWVHSFSSSDQGCIDHCDWVTEAYRDHTSLAKEVCMREPDQACNWVAGSSECKRTRQCKDNDFPPILGSSVLPTKKKWCAENNIKADPCLCWHFGSVGPNIRRDSAGVDKHICKLCNLCEGSPFQDYDQFKKQCLDETIKQRQEQEKIDIELEEKRLKYLKAVTKQANYDMMSAIDHKNYAKV